MSKNNESIIPTTDAQAIDVLSDFFPKMTKLMDSLNEHTAKDDPIDQWHLMYEIGYLPAYQETDHQKLYFPRLDRDEFFFLLTALTKYQIRNKQPLTVLYTGLITRVDVGTMIMPSEFFFSIYNRECTPITDIVSFVRRNRQELQYHFTDPTQYQK
jgi:hypothetical protein